MKSFLYILVISMIFQNIEVFKLRINQYSSMNKFAVKLFELNKQQLLKNKKIDPNMQSFPQNLPYMQTQTKQQPIFSSQSEVSVPDSQVLMARIHDLQQKLSELSALLTQDNGMQEAYYQLQQQNEELRGMLSVHSEGRQSQLEAANQLLKENLLKQNEEMEELYKELQQARHSQSRLQERGHSQLLQSKVQELNDQISNLLVKIQQLVDENNSQQQAIAQFQQMQNMFKEYENKNKEMQVQNQILKGQIRNLEDNYISQIARMKAETQNKQNTQRTKLRPTQVRKNTEKTEEEEEEERAELEQEIVALRTELETRIQQDHSYRQNEAHLRRKWEQRLAASQEQISVLNEEVNKLRTLLRQQENKCSQYQFVLDQQQKDRERLAFYKNSYADSQTLRNKIVRLQAQKEELLFKTQRLKVELSQRKFESPPLAPLPQKSQRMNFLQSQAEQELQKCKRLNKELKSSICRYEKDYRQLRQQYEQLLHQKIKAVETITSNQIQLQRHKEIYEQVVARCNATTIDYKQLQKKVLILQEQRNARVNLSNYDKENSQLIQLENSALRQEIASLKEQLTSAQNFNVSLYDSQAKRRQRQIVQQLQMYRQKYLKQLEKGKKDKEKESSISQLQQKLVRVNRVLNQKMKELQRLQARQAELQQELNKTYARCKIQFQNFGVRHHPQVKRLQNDLLAAQRQIMESELAFKTQMASCEDELKACRLQNQHHRAKIDQLLLEVNRERNSLDYSKLARSLELNELTIKQLQRQLQHKDKLLEETRFELKKIQSRQRTRVETSLNHKDIHLQREKQNLQAKIMQRETDIQALTQYLNALEPKTRLQDPLKRVIKYLSKIASNGSMNSLNEGLRKDSTSSKESQYSRYDELLRKKSLIAQQFKHSQQFLIEQPMTKEQRKDQKVGILRRLQENLST